MTETGLYEPMLVPRLWAHALRQRRSRPVLHIGDQTLTAGEIEAEVSRYAQALVAQGLGPGSPVATVALNRPEVLYSWGAGMQVGCRATPLTAAAALEDQAFILADAEIDTLLFDPELQDRAAALSERVPGLKRLLSLGPGDLGIDFTALARSYGARSLRPPVVEPETIDRIMYTGGTTGRPKGVMGSYRSAAAVIAIQMAEWQWPEQHRFLICSPLSHAGAAFVLPTLLRGGWLMVLPRFDPDQVLDMVERYRITAMMVVPTMLYTLLDHPRLGHTDVSSLETIYYGAAAMSPGRLEEAIDRFGPIFFQFYGQSECPITITVLRREEHDVNRPGRLSSCGRPVPWLDVALLDDDCHQVDPGQPGEICARGPLVMSGYWRQPAETEQVFRGGWVHTGDVAVEDEEGYLTIVDRKKDMIVSGGFNVFAREVEDVLTGHPAVAAVAVIGVPDEKWGEAVKALVVLRPEATASPEELARFVRDRKGPVQAPKSVEFIDALPTTPLGKIDKAALRDRYWTGQERRVH
jgi:acyl-CoA synthetase (AMP-forming)/AMP-acid ligase II